MSEKEPKAENVPSFFFKADCNEIVIDDDEDEFDENKILYFCVKCEKECLGLEEMYEHEATKFHLRDVPRYNYQNTTTQAAEEKWCAENLCQHLGFCSVCDECGTEDKPILNARTGAGTRTEAQSSDEDGGAEMWDEEDAKEWECSSDDEDMRAVRRKIHHPFESISSDFGLPSDDDEGLQEFQPGVEKPFGEGCSGRGRRVELETLEPVGKEESVETEEGELVDRLPGGWVSFARGLPGGAVHQRVVQVRHYVDHDHPVCCPKTE